LAHTEPSDMVDTLEAALASNAGVVEVVVDGTRVRYDRAQALRELDYWKREAARKAGTRPKIASINLGSAW